MFVNLRNLSLNVALKNFFAVSRFRLCFRRALSCRFNAHAGLQRNVNANDIDIGWDIKVNGLELTELILAYLTIFRRETILGKNNQTWAISVLFRWAVRLLLVHSGRNVSQNFRTMELT